MKLLIWMSRLALGFAFMNGALAQEYQYTYTGSDFTYLSPNIDDGGSYISNPFSTSENITMSLVVNGLYSSQSIPLSSVTSLSLDGAVWIDVAQLSFVNSGSVLTTDSNGQIASWDLNLSGYYFSEAPGSPVRTITSTGVVSTNVGADSYSWLDSLTPGIDFYANSSIPGTWIVAPIPEPPTYLMVLVGIAIIVIRRRKNFNGAHK